MSLYNVIASGYIAEGNQMSSLASNYQIHMYNETDDLMSSWPILLLVFKSV